VPEDQDAQTGRIWRALYEAFLRQHEARMHAVAALGTTPGELKALLHLLPGGSATTGELAREWNNDPSTTTWLVDRLEARGLVERRPDPRDRRVKRVVLTEQGLRARQQVTDELYRPPETFTRLDQGQLDAVDALARTLGSTDTGAP
jgi:DNA-binding MarR family transcriptional regulator